MNSIPCQNCGHQNPPEFKFCSECGTPLSGSTELPRGKKLREKYIIEEILGRGGFGRTYLAEDTGRFGEKVVVKELSPSLQGTYALQKAEELFQREAQTLYKLEHPQIPRFRETFQHERRLFLVQDFVKGQDYLSLVRERSPGRYFSEDEIIQLFQQLLPVLSYIHRQGVIHRDISPDNIVQRQSDGVPVLVDFGGVKEFSKHVATQIGNPDNPPISGNRGTSLVKSGYSPDEQLRGRVAPNSDLYALAASALCLMTGKERPTQELWDAETGKWFWQEQLSLSPKLAEALNRMLEDRPELRFQSADEVRQFMDGETKQMLAAPTVLPVELSEPKSLGVPAAIAGSLSWSIAIAPIKFLGYPLGIALWAIALGALVFWGDRPKNEKIYLFTVAVISTLATLSLLPADFFEKTLFSSQTLIQIGLLTILAGAISLIVTTLYQLFARLFNSNQ